MRLLSFKALFTFIVFAVLVLVFSLFTPEHIFLNEANLSAPTIIITTYHSPERFNSNVPPK